MNEWLLLKLTYLSFTAVDAMNKRIELDFGRSQANIAPKLALKLLISIEKVNR